MLTFVAKEGRFGRIITFMWCMIKMLKESQKSYNREVEKNKKAETTLDNY